MQKLFFVLCLFGYSQIYSQKSDAIAATNTLANQKKAWQYLPNTVIIKFKTSSPQSGQTSEKRNNPQLQIKSAQVLSLKRKFPFVNSFENIESKNKATKKNEPAENFDLGNIYELIYNDNTEIDQVISEILKDTNVLYAEPNYIYHTLYNPNDSSFTNNSQLYLQQVEAIRAWDVESNASDMIIAIIDSGTDLGHEDLQNNIYLNKKDPINGIDDDNDGFLDNYYGWDFMGQKTTTPIQDNNPQVIGDKANHGVHVSGLLSAVTNNNKGIASVAVNAKLMIIKASSDENSDNIVKGYEGIKYAVDHGAKIINCSWGGTEESFLGRDIINYAISKDCLVVAAAGNNNTTEPIYPAAYKGVLAVANVNGEDIKSPSSSFGNYVSLAAPGTNILSTLYGNNYGNRSGTSMSAPLVASAAALLKSHMPDYSMQQIAQQLRVTADDIDNKNPNYVGKLGHGRLNIFQALTRKSPSIRNEKLTVDSNTLFPGDTALIYFDLKNYLAPTNNLVFSLSTKSPYIKIIDQQFTVGHLESLTTTHMVGPFRLCIAQATPVNADIILQLHYSDANVLYSDNEAVDVKVNLDYLNFAINKISTTMTSNGRIGYSQTNASNGIGFRYNGTNLLYESSLMIGTSPVSISNNTRNGFGSDEDFLRVKPIQRFNTSAPYFEAHSEFNDALSNKPLNISIRHRLLAFPTAPDDKYIIAEYKLVNNNNFDLVGVYIGLFTDWDLGVNALDETKYDPILKLAYAFGKSNQSFYSGVKLLSTNAAPAYFPLSKEIETNPLSNGFTKSEKFKCLSSGINSFGLGTTFINGLDVSFISGYGPYKIPPKDSVIVAFALIAGHDYADLQSAARQSQIKYDKLFPDNVFQTNQITLDQNYPNPFSDYTQIEFSIPSNGKVRLVLSTLTGIQTRSILDATLASGKYAVRLNRDDMLPGIYVYTLYFNGIQESKKLILLK